MIVRMEKLCEKTQFSHTLKAEEDEWKLEGISKEPIVISPTGTHGSNRTSNSIKKGETRGQFSKSKIKQLNT